MSAIDTVEPQVRELVRRRGLDPVEDRAAMRRLVDEVVGDYDERALNSSLPPLPDLRVAARAVDDAVAGFGPLQRHLDDTDGRGDLRQVAADRGVRSFVAAFVLVGVVPVAVGVAALVLSSH